MVKLQYDRNEQFKVTLPKQICAALGWKKGDTISIRLNDKGEMNLSRKP